MRQKKSLGQNFLIDKNIAKKIVRSAKISKTDIVWEIGVGKGILTNEILKNCRKLVAFEIDKNWVEYLKTKIDPDYVGTKLEIIHSDILKANFNEFAEPKKIKIIANLPYQITSPFIFKVLEHREMFSLITIMIQREVANRIVSNAGGREYGRISVKTQLFFDLSKLFHVPPHLFKPQPKVVSTVIQMKPKAGKLEVENQNLLFAIIDKSFQQRRKMLRSSLKNFIKDCSINSIEFDLTKRPEQLTTADFIELANEVDRCCFNHQNNAVK